jgi:hypothetical protein
MSLTSEWKAAGRGCTMSVRTQLFTSCFKFVLLRVSNRISAGYRDQNLVMQSMFKVSYASSLSGPANAFLFIFYVPTVPPD